MPNVLVFICNYVSGFTLWRIHLFVNVYVMKRKFKQRWSITPPISTKQIVTSHLHSIPEHKKRIMLEIIVLAWDMHKHVAVLTRLMGPPLWRG
jgi:hypothetical protein